MVVNVAEVLPCGQITKARIYWSNNYYNYACISNIINALEYSCHFALSYKVVNGIKD